MAKKNKTIENVTFNTSHWEGKTKEEFMAANKGLYNKHFTGYPDQEERAERQLSEAWDILTPAGKKEDAQLSAMDTPGEALPKQKK